MFARKKGKGDSKGYIPAPDHIAFIMDGNRRYAEKIGIPKRKSYLEGASNMVSVVEGCIELGVKYASFFAFSIENWNREEGDVGALMSVAREIMRDMDYFPRIIQLGARIKFFGQVDLFDKDIVDGMKRLEEESKNNSKIMVQVGVSYSGRSEITEAVRRIAKMAEVGLLSVNCITEEIVAQQMFTYPVPDPDMLIRTGNEKRISNFMLWQISYCELFFFDKMWPVFSRSDLLAAVEEFNSRARRYGRF